MVDKILKSIIESDKKKWNSELEVANFVASYCSMTNISSVLEFGTYRGLTPYILSKLDTIKTIVTVDTVDNFSSVLKKIEDKYAQKITFLHANTNDVNKLVKKQYFDLIYIDADHSLESVFMDFLSAINYCKCGSTIFFHDAKSNDFGVVLFINFLNKFNKLTFNRFFSTLTLDTPKGSGLSLVQTHWNREVIKKIIAFVFSVRLYLYLKLKK